MALCTLCQTIPFDSVPDSPASDMSADINVFLPLLTMRPAPPTTKSGEQNEDLGFPWHQNLETLAASAASSGCPLCSIVKCGVDLWMSRFREAEQKASKSQEEWRHAIPRDEKIWLAKRPYRASGLLVLAQHPISEEHIIILSAVSLSVDADSSLADVFPLRPFDPYSGSVRSLDKAAAWLDACVRTHSLCSRSSGEMPLPSRVLDVGGVSANSIKLIECRGDIRGKYACLSHCWGGKVSMRTTRTTYEARISGISMAHLPRSFADAVVITRRLGLRFLWIDSLCIIQDDRSDWARESSRMADVYSNAHVVLAANRAANSAAGIFHMRNARPSAVVADMPLRVGGAIVTSPDLVYVQLLRLREERHQFLEPNATLSRREPLSLRGWALQERVLARRLLHFSTHKMYYECCDGGLVCEGGWHRKQRSYDVYRADVDHHTLWDSLLFDYGCRKLTNVSDRLPAMSGLANIMKGRGNLGGERQYVAGLWSDRLVPGLAWTAVRGRRPANRYIGPTWSWASYDGIPSPLVPRYSTSNLEEWRDVAEVIDWRVELKDDVNPYGEVRSAWIRLRAPMTGLWLRKKSLTDHETDGKRRWSRMCTMWLWHIFLEHGMLISLLTSAFSAYQFCSYHYHSYFHESSPTNSFASNFAFFYNTAVQIMIILANILVPKKPLLRDMKSNWGLVCPDDKTTKATPEAWWNEETYLLILGLKTNADADQRATEELRSKIGAEEPHCRPGKEMKTITSLFGLVLVPAGEDRQQSRTMKRVGHMKLEGPRCAELMADSENRTVVTLV